MSKFELPTQPDQQEEFELSTMVALFSAAFSMVLQQPILAWLSLFFAVTSIFNNAHRTSSSILSTLQALMFSVLALTTLYTKKLIDPTVI
ncbi:hypothetical protein PCANC_07500 [Puccinia coronata f. sp. avenae]|uniref:Uncharacterized protein n=1 Tax=Puccinia coronata f. sp. avenae TaxID=200324 RepID=A0A2N5VG24_9BASI|nr:hypothetical protein PCANC_14209 [Puccinia coronata f. sp. avenae]PLW48846.1 hypothetical protein PCASD_02811 [Puccinia coronata f. sp. avenae]PLW53251.1 hypothetical protein PCANC_07500 [Puccinia coronata f. sp. avenae]